VNKRVYFITPSQDEEFGVAVIGKSVKQVKKDHHNNIFDCEYIDMRVKWLKHISKKIIEDIPYGEIELRLALKIGAYYWIEDYCDNCGKSETMDSDSIVRNKILCDKCLKKEKDLNSYKG